MLKIYAIFTLFTNAKNPVWFIYQIFRVFIQIQYHNHYFFYQNELYTGLKSFSMSMRFLNNRKFHKLQNARALSTAAEFSNGSANRSQNKCSALLSLIAGTFFLSQNYTWYWCFSWQRTTLSVYSKSKSILSLSPLPFFEKDR